MPRTKSSVGGAASAFMASSCLVLVLNFVSGVLTARTLSASGRGELAALVIWIQNLSWVFALGVTEAIQFFGPRVPANRLLTVTAFFALGCGLIGLVGAEIILPFALHAQRPQVLLIGRIAVAAIFIVIPTEFGKATLAGRQEFKFLNAMRVGQPAVYVTTILVLYFVHRAQVSWVLMASYATGLAFLIAIVIQLKKESGFGRFDRKLAGEVARYGIRVHGGNLAGLANKQLDLMVLPAIVAAAPIGLYAVASNLASLVLTLMGSLSIILLPEVSRRASGDAIKLSFRAARIALVVCAVMGLTIALIGPIFIKIAYGSEFLGAVLPLRILLLGTVLLSGASLLIAGLQGIGEPGEATRVSVTGMVVTLVGLSLTLHPYGIIGAAWTSLVSYTTTFLMAYFRLRAKGHAGEKHLAPGQFAGDLKAIKANLMRRTATSLAETAE